MHRNLKWFTRLLPTMLLGLSLAHAQDLLTITFPTAPTPVRAMTPAYPARAETAAYPVQPAAGIDFSGLTGGAVQIQTATQNNPFLQRLEEERRQAEQDYQDAVASGNEKVVRAALVRLMTAEGRLTAAVRQPNAMFFPALAQEVVVGDLEQPGSKDDTQDYGLLPGGLRRLTFFREYVRLGSMISRMVDGNVQIRTGQDGGETELKVFVLKTPYNNNFPISKTKEATDPSGFMFEGDVPDKKDPTIMVKAWRFDSSSGNPKNRDRAPVVNIRNEGSFDGVYDGNNIRVARIQPEYFEQGGKRVLQRAYYREGQQTPLATMVTGDYNGDPCLNLRNGGGPDAPVVFQFVFSGWLPGTTRKNQPLKSDAAFREVLGRFLDAWVTSEAWRKQVGIAHNFGASND